VSSKVTTLVIAAFQVVELSILVQGGVSPGVGGLTGRCAEKGGGYELGGYWVDLGGSGGMYKE